MTNKNAATGINELPNIKCAPRFKTEKVSDAKNRLIAARERLEEIKKLIVTKENDILESERQKEQIERQKIEEEQRLQAEKLAKIELEKAEAERKKAEAEAAAKANQKTEQSAVSVEMPDKTATVASQTVQTAESSTVQSRVTPTATAPQTAPAPRENRRPQYGQGQNATRQNIQTRVFDTTSRPNQPRYNNNQGTQRTPRTDRPQQNGTGYKKPAWGPKPMPVNVVIPPVVGGKNQNVKKKAAPIDDKKTQNKRSLIRKGYITDDGYYTDVDDFDGGRRIRANKKVKKNEFNQPQNTKIESAVITSELVPIKVLSEKIGKTGTEIIKQLFLLDIVKTINESIDFDTASLVAGVFGIELKYKPVTTAEEMAAIATTDETDDEKDLVTRPPVVTIMGHVDHGKTSLLDFIRKSEVAAGEAGGITQHIGAYTVTLNGAPITFLDTPGHEAFTAMRMRGAQVTDIAVIVVAADDGIMPQTVEAINHAKAANVSIIIAVNKIDKTGANPDRVLQQLTDYNLVPEEWGGDIPVVRVSAKTGENVNKLLETILLVAEILELKANPKRKGKGAIVEAKLDKGRGPIATVLVQNGTLKVGDTVVVGEVVGKIRAMFDDKGRPSKEAGPSAAVSVLGFTEVPNAGDQLLVVDEKLAKQVAEERKNKARAEVVATKSASLEDIFGELEAGVQKDLNLIIKADVQGSVEAVKQALLKLGNDEVKINVIHGAVGAVNESDVMLAKTSHAIIIGFNVRPDNNAKIMSDRDKIDIRVYRIIYDAIDDVEAAIKGMLAPKFKENVLGRAEIRQVYKITGVGAVAGCMVIDGKVTRNAKIRLLREGVIVYDGNLSSLKRFKDDVKEVAKGFDCGMSIEKFSDIKEGDVIEAYEMVQINE